MKAEQFGPELRQNALRRRLERGSALFLSTAAKEFGVSVDSIRRDLKALEEQGIARCIRGGALPVARPVRPALERMARIGVPSCHAIVALACVTGYAVKHDSAIKHWMNGFRVY